MPFAYVGGIQTRELLIRGDGVELPATLMVPSARVRGGVVPLHPAYEPSRRMFLFEHLARVLPPCGIAVLRYDRRPAEGADDVPFAVQAADALAAVGVLRSSIGDAPVGLWGWSQGAWAAPRAAAESTDVAFLILVASSGVSPAAQMRYAAAEQLRRAGYGHDALADLARVRSAVEDALRGGRTIADAQVVVDLYADREWFPLAYLPRTLPVTARWTDIDFDPEPVYARVRCPVLLFYGETDEAVPPDESIAVWRRAATLAGNDAVEIVRLQGATHVPTIGGVFETDAISPTYEQTMVRWLDEVLAR